jgi:hypothetical protein
MIRSHHDLPNPAFVGVFPKLTMQAPPELSAAGVSEIASVSSCMSMPPEDWIGAWKHNDFGFYDSEEAAVSVLPAESATRYDLYAYELIPVECSDNIDLPEVNPARGAVPRDYEFLGYDIVSRSMSSYFECSPLSCNLAATIFPVNTHCLVAALSEAYAALIQIGGESAGYEPGPYYLFRVHRKRRAA